MKCAVCGGDTRVTETASYDDHVARKRVCKKCGTVVYTCEEVTDFEEGRKDVNFRQRRYLMS